MHPVFVETQWECSSVSVETQPECSEIPCYCMTVWVRVKKKCFLPARFLLQVQSFRICVCKGRCLVRILFLLILNQSGPWILKPCATQQSGGENREIGHGEKRRWSCQQRFGAFSRCIWRDKLLTELHATSGQTLDAAHSDEVLATNCIAVICLKIYGGKIQHGLFFIFFAIKLNWNATSMQQQQLMDCISGAPPRKMILVSHTSWLAAPLIEVRGI